MQIDYNVGVPMRDGTRLSALVCRPQGSGPFPAVLWRSCYTKWRMPLAERGPFWTAAGYALVLQDVRGRGDSDGEFYPLINERQDGLDTLDWLTAQPWSDGRVCMLGGSYAGWTQLYLACANHPALIAVSPTVTPPDPDRSFPIHHGIPVPAAAAWMASLDGRTNQDLATSDVAGAYGVRPLIDFDRHIGRDLPVWRDWIEQPPGAPYWLRQRYQGDLPGSHVPMLHVSGWYDDCLVGTLENFVAMTQAVRASGAPVTQRMIIGPWMHGATGQRNAGGLDFGPAAEMNLPQVQRDWFDTLLQEAPDGSPPVRLFVMGRNAWLTEGEWPPARTRYVPFYLHSTGRANSRLGDGTLSTVPPADEPADSFRYDPDQPVPYCADFDWKQVGGPDDFAQIELRQDILVYTTDELTEPLLICGPLKVHLFADSSAFDTDWTAKVLDVYPDGRAIRLNDGVVRARFRNGTEREELLTPGRIEEYHIDCWATCVEIAPGHKLRLEIASSAFGKTDVNLNGGGRIGRETRTVIAHQVVHHDVRRPSHLLLPVLGDSA
jgi:uncharacterized protein